MESRPHEPVDVDAILEELGDEFDDPGDSPWGGANLEWHPSCPCPGCQWFSRLHNMEH